MVEVRASDLTDVSVSGLLGVLVMCKNRNTQTTMFSTYHKYKLVCEKGQKKSIFKLISHA